MLSMGLVASPLVLELISVSQLKRLEMREGALGPKDKERNDFAVAREFIPRQLLLTPKPGTQQDWLARDVFCNSITEVLQELLSPRRAVSAVSK